MSKNDDEVDLKPAEEMPNLDHYSVGNDPEYNSTATVQNSTK